MFEKPKEKLIIRTFECVESLKALPFDKKSIRHPLKTMKPTIANRRLSKPSFTVSSSSIRKRFMKHRSRKRWMNMPLTIL